MAADPANVDLSGEDAASDVVPDEEDDVDRFNVLAAVFRPPLAKRAERRADLASIAT